MTVNYQLLVPISWREAFNKAEYILFKFNCQLFIVNCFGRAGDEPSSMVPDFGRRRAVCCIFCEPRKLPHSAFAKGCRAHPSR